MLLVWRDNRVQQTIKEGVGAERVKEESEKGSVAKKTCNQLAEE